MNALHYNFREKIDFLFNKTRLKLIIFIVYMIDDEFS